MGENSNIEWTTHTFNPWMGCVKVSAGCKNCYAERESLRHGLKVFGPAATTERRVCSETYWRNPVKWNRQAEKDNVRPRVFCASFADVFEDNGQLLDPRRRLFELIEATPHLDWLLLTKRPENIQPFYSEAGFDRWIASPPRNVWLGTSIENMDSRARIEELQSVPAVIRFLSIEPLIGPVGAALQPLRLYGQNNIDWVIVGGESGPRDKIRPMYPLWADQVYEWAKAKRIAFFFKQWGNFAPGWIDDPDDPAKNVMVWPDGRVKPLTEKPQGNMLLRELRRDGVVGMSYSGTKYIGTLNGTVQHNFPEVTR